MAYYKLIDAVDVPRTVTVATRENNRTEYKRIRLEPHKKYELPSDTLLLEELKKATLRVKYSPEYEEILKKCGARYEVKLCPSCGGRVRKIEYHIVEVVE